MSTKMKVWTAEEIKELINTNNAFVARSLVKLFERQTADEQNSEMTKYQNKMGFSAFDADILSSMAKQFQRYGKLTEKQTVVARRRLQKYTKQLTRIANGEG